MAPVAAIHIQNGYAPFMPGWNSGRGLLHSSLGRFVVERIRRFRFAGSGSDDVPPFRFELFRPLAHPGEDLPHVVAALAGDVVADAVNLGQNCVLVHGSTSHQIIRRANDRAIVAELFAETLDAAERKPRNMKPKS